MRTSGRRMIVGVTVMLVLAISAPVLNASPWATYSVRNGSWQADDPGRRPYRQDEDRREYSPRREERESQRPQRLSPEERQQLRRDIKDAGREIYPKHR